jgi:hypothetical protein
MQDTIGTRAACIKATRAALSATPPRSVVIDATNVDSAIRAEWVSLAKELQVPIRAIAAAAGASALALDNAQALRRVSPLGEPVMSVALHRRHSLNPCSPSDALQEVPTAVVTGAPCPTLSAAHRPLPSRATPLQRQKASHPSLLSPCAVGPCSSLTGQGQVYHWQQGLRRGCRGLSSCNVR